MLSCTLIIFWLKLFKYVRVLKTLGETERKLREKPSLAASDVHSVTLLGPFCVIISAPQGRSV